MKMRAFSRSPWRSPVAACERCSEVSTHVMGVDETHAGILKSAEVAEQLDAVLLRVSQ